MKIASLPSPALTSAHKIKEYTCVKKTALRSGNHVMALAPMMITSTFVGTSVQSLPAPAATLCLVLTPAVPASSPTEREQQFASRALSLQTLAPPRWTVLVIMWRTVPTGATAMKTAPPLSPAPTFAHKIKGYTCVERSVLRRGDPVTDPAPMMITTNFVGTSVQSLPAPAATPCLVLTLADPASSPLSELMG